jgi:hypothetical protein
MPVFISYCRADSAFATRLAEQLVKHKAHVWIDQWELHVGDSLINRIQEAIQGASGLLVILSKTSVESEWCKKELSTGLIRELEEKRVVVLPVLMEDCNIPLFLRDKLYADFRKNFDDGLKAVLESIARATSDSLVRVDSPQWHVDWAVDWGMEDDAFGMYMLAVEQATGNPFSVVTEIRIRGNRTATDRYLGLLEAGLDWVEKGALIELLADAAAEKDIRLRLDDEHAKMVDLVLNDSKSGSRYAVHIRSRRVGQDTGRDVLLNIGGQLHALRAGQRGTYRNLTKHEEEKLRAIQDRFATRPPNPTDYIAV